VANSFKDKVAALLAKQEAAKKRSQDALRERQAHDQQKNEEFTRCRAEVYKPVMEEAAEVLHGRVTDNDIDNRLPPVPAITFTVGLSSITYRAGTPARTIVVYGKRPHEPADVLVGLPTTREDFEKEFFSALERVFHSR